MVYFSQLKLTYRVKRDTSMKQISSNKEQKAGQLSAKIDEHEDPVNVFIILCVVNSTNFVSIRLDIKLVSILFKLNNLQPFL